MVLKGLLVLVLLGLVYSDCVIPTEIQEAWGYVDVRPKAHMFWWFMKTPCGDVDNRPIIIWLQGGPGCSATGYGNFMEIGEKQLISKGMKSFAHMMKISQRYGASLKNLLKQLLNRKMNHFMHYSLKFLRSTRQQSPTQKLHLVERSQSALHRLSSWSRV